jgi:geranylgeranyl diphosphate synthase type II
MFDFKNFMKYQQKRVNDKLANLFNQAPQRSRLLSAMNYSLMAGGKRVRPILCISTASAVNNNRIDVLPVACALECIHTYSLIHDDLPSMDNDDLRRGNPTCHKAFDEPTAILAGDALLTVAFEILSDKAHFHHNPQALLEIIHIISKAAGPYGMIEGQMRDIASESQRLNEMDLEQLHLLKTGALIKASVLSGAILANATEKQKQQLNIYAQNIGLAFQVIDDVLNVKGDPKRMGKATGTDQDLQKNTYPGLLGLSSAEAKARQLIQKAIESLQDFNDQADPLRAIASYILQRDH